MVQIECVGFFGQREHRGWDPWIVCPHSNDGEVVRVIFLIGEPIGATVRESESRSE